MEGQSRRRVVAGFWVFGIVLMVTGCASVNNEMQSWVGHQSELIAAWVPPARYASENDGQILIYLGYRDLGQTPGK